MRERGLTMLVVEVLDAEPPLRRRPRPHGPADLADEAGGDQVLAGQLGVPGSQWDSAQSWALPRAGDTHSPPCGWPMTCAAGRVRGAAGPELAAPQHRGHPHPLGLAGTAAIRIAARLLGAGCVV